MAPVQIGAIWVHAFLRHCRPSAPRWPKRRQGRPKEAKGGAPGLPKATQEKPLSCQEYGSSDTNLDWYYTF